MTVVQQNFVSFSFREERMNAIEFEILFPSHQGDEMLISHSEIIYVKTT